jgi:hypothetical protein
LAIGLAEPALRPGAATYRYEVEVGLPPLEASAVFPAEPQIKTEALTFLAGRRALG